MTDERPWHRDRRVLAWCSALILVLAGVAVAYLAPQRTPPTHHAHAQPGKTKPPPAAPPQARFLAITGGATPDSNPISLEQNLALAHAVLPGPGVLLFGSGSSGTTVQVLASDLPQDELRDRLGALFAPRAGRDSRYQSASLPAQSATMTSVRTELSIALARAGAPLLVYISGHGQQGQTPRDNLVQLWGGDGLSAVDMAELHDHARARRELRLVITNCYSGGFAELAFAGADADKGFTKKARCGLFATTADLESSGCDPNPNRAEQEGYSVHMLNALRGLDRDGKTSIDADYDDDGKVSLLEAHTRATIASRSIDIPTTTSERFLREHTATLEADATPDAGASHDANHDGVDDDARMLPEADAVIAALGAALHLTDTHAVTRRLDALEAELTTASEALQDADAAHDDAYNTLAMWLLERWPVIDDPWHPLFVDTMRDHREAILSELNSSEAAQRYAQTEADVRTREEQLNTLQTRYAVLARLQRAHDNRRLAHLLKRQGGKVWSQYLQLLSCERGLP